MVTLFGASYEAECGLNAVFRKGNAIKFILRPGESWPTDISGGSDGHRAELDGYRQIMSVGATYWCAWQFQMDAGPISRASWLLSRQYHNAYNHWINRATQRIVFAKTGGNPIGSVPLVYGRVYSFVERIIPGTSGRVTTWVDGVLVAEPAGAKMLVRYGERVEVDGRRARLARPDLPVPEADNDLVTALKAWRLERARRDGVPAYVVLHDSHIEEIARRAPATLRELASCPGIGPTKLDRYGDEILAIVDAAGGI